MSVRFTPILTLLSLFLLCAPLPLSAAEVTNLKPVFTSTQLTLEYDLIGAPGEKSSGIEILLDLHGKRYSAHELTLSGDFGRSIPVGKKRRIVWKHSKDIPEGLDKSFKCIVNAVPNGTVVREELNPSEGILASRYAVSKQVVVDTPSRLMWSRSASIAPKPMVFAEAQKMIKQLNTERFAGYNDWRMPTREDFEALVSAGIHAGWGSRFTRYIADYLLSCGFTAVQNGNYWTSTPSPENSEQLYVINSWNGVPRPLAGTNFYYLWPVRTVK